MGLPGSGLPDTGSSEALIAIPTRALWAVAQAVAGFEALWSCRNQQGIEGVVARRAAERSWLNEPDQSGMGQDVSVLFVHYEPGLRREWVLCREQALRHEWVLCHDWVLPRE